VAAAFAALLLSGTALVFATTTRTAQPTAGAGNGSGEFLDTAGHVLTNNHVISSAVGGGTIVVLRPNGEELPATLVGRDISTDLAVVKVESKEPAQPVASTSPRPRSAGPPPGPA
jgi:putative serine protease PepD